MQHFHRVPGVAAAIISTAVLAACSGPLPPAPPAVAGVPPAPPAEVFPAYPAAPPPAPGAYIPPQYGPTVAPANLPSSAGTLTTPVVAPYAPPPPRVETPPSAPSALAVWQPGHWAWTGTNYSWMPGHYVDRPSSTASWVPGYWQQGPNGWVWVDGRWV
jgi:WXXGXW repeat (2 copies)